MIGRGIVFEWTWIVLNEHELFWLRNGFEIIEMTDSDEI